jgi:two-component system cell cycle sensor histidine kinase/response regulator CckA
MLKLDLVAHSNNESHSAENLEVLPGNIDDPAAESLFEAMKGALRRSDRVNLSGFGFFVVKPRKRAQEAISLLSAIFDSSSDAVMAASLDGKIVAWNRGASSIYEYDPEEVVGRHLSILAADPRSTDLDNAISKLKRGAGSIEMEIASVARSGRRLTIQQTVSAINNRKGRVVAVAIVARDVTERWRREEELRKSEEWFHALAEESADLSVVLDSTGTIRFVNNAARRLLGYRPNDLSGATPTDWIHPEDLPQLALAARDCLQVGRINGIRFRARHSDGSWRTLEAAARNRLDDDAIAGIVVNARDITDRIRTEEQLRKGYGQAQRIEAAEHLANAVSRDLDNLLTTVCGYADLIIARTRPDDRLHHDAREVKRAGELAAELSRRLSVFGGSQLLRATLVDLNSMVEGLDTRLRAILGKDIAVVMALESELGRVAVDRDQLEEAIINIIINAREAMPSGGTLTIETQNVDLQQEPQTSLVGLRSGRYVVLALRDSGSGMLPDIQSRVFEPFYTTKGGHRRGVGLSDAHGIIKQGGGQLSVFSEPSAGTSFRIYLPRADNADLFTADTERTPRTGTETVLVVQPDEAVRALIRETLETRGYNILEARGGVAAIHCLRTYPAPIHLLLTDASLGDVGTNELAVGLRNQRPETKALVIHGYTPEASEPPPSEDFAYVEYIRKPFRASALATKVREALDSDCTLPSKPRTTAESAGDQEVA